MLKIKDINIYKKILIVGVPVALENLVYNFINFVDNFMVGKTDPVLGLGTNAVSGLGISNQIFFVYIISLFGLFSGAGVLSSQYFGSKNYSKMNKISGFLTITSLVLSIPFIIIGLTNPEILLKFYSKDHLVLEQAMRYFKYVSFTFPLAGLGFVFSMQLRVISESKYSFYASIVGLTFNILGNLILIPRLGVKGAAIATVIARLFSLIYMIYIVKKNKFPILSSYRESIFFEFALVKDIIKISLPAFIHEFVWVMGITYRASIYSNMGAVEFSAVIISGTISSMLISVFSGVSNASSVLIGNELGANNLMQAKKIAKLCFKLMLLLAILSGILVNIISPLVLNFMKAESSLISTTRLVVFSESLILPFKGLNFLIIVGILRAGGDIYYAMMLDLVGMWIFSVPLTLLGKSLSLPINIIYFLGGSSDILVLLPAILRYNQKKWVKRIIRD
ncbi:MATE family efflux transporter [Streptobacillus moniliformis]|uniref:Multidrug-efflux transporter n=1 Tax=Streptobacillus moniliformis (strain ATCC 14647 / DSM 12112 / NCTC 10651 / 9901) TaxID=519441 RepID=D1AYT3_STRM9|nr:MATE family efflux transporter [Streptobacillus moniliformis]ACZ01459.1 MATE efflux family protein [Streptobacillus moniliformis DSM 12112]AVL43535.1 MATE family efflux transporter [Streptobacillus moniliformis]SQA13380.1 Na(+)/drug antiporter [Streptobacillus moniliformis]